MHKDLQGTHIEDMVAGGELGRKKDYAMRNFEVGREGLATEIELLKAQIEHIQKLLEVMRGRISSSETESKEIQRHAEQREDRNESGLSDESRKIRKDNEGLSRALLD